MYQGAFRGAILSCGQSFVKAGWCVNPLIDAWIEKVEGDFHAAGRELRVRTHPVYHASCFLSQQCAKKRLKAFLEFHGISPSLEILRADLLELERYAVRAAVRQRLGLSER
ncbi:MAG: HEPN domain-containing protein [Chloroflexi bacterium]|nr:MAG: HEPN domain-containing protein [Chloroflexota bacterium]